MDMDDLKNITEVCRMFGMTSRTIRYYEQCGLIDTVRTSPKAPRRLDSENIERLKKIRFLRNLGLSLEEISVMLRGEIKAEDMIRSKSADFTAEILSLKERIKLLQDVIETVNNGGDIYSVEPKLHDEAEESEKKRIAYECVNLIIERRFPELILYGNDLMKKVSPDLLESAWDKEAEVRGKFISVGEQSVDGNLVITRVNFDKKSIDLKINVCCGLVTGLIMNYVSDKM